MLSFSVTDTGMGIPPDKLEAIFRPFEQVDMSSTREFGGTGLGLAISKRIVQRLGGAITVQSTLGEGSTFQFSIPFGANPSASSSRDTAALEGLRVLVVDDNATNRRILEETLGFWKIAVSMAANAREAISEMDSAQTQSKPFDLILLDYMIPGMDGLGLASHIHARPGCAEMKMVMLSSGIVDAGQARSRGISAVLTKPVGRSELLDAMVDALGHHGAQPVAFKLSKSTDPLKILLIEDNAINREVAHAMLTHRGHHLQTACNGEQGVAAACEGVFDVILMDLQMPVMDGFQAATAIRQHELKLGRHTPILALTAHAVGDVQTLCLAAGMDGYVPKPFRQAELIAALEQFSPMV